MAGRHGTRAGDRGTRPGRALSSSRVTPERARTRSASRRAALVAGGCALALPVAAAVGLTAAGIPVLPQGPVAPAAAVSPPPPPPLAVVTTTPASAALASVLATGPGRGWSPSGPITWAPGTPFDHACRASGPPSAAVAGERVFTSTGGTDVTVEMRAFGAGTGAAAFERLRARLATCPGRDASVDATTVSLTDGAGATLPAIAGTVLPDGAPSAVASVSWRRGDVVLTVLAPRSDPSSLFDVARAVDATAVARLTPVCPQLSSGVGDAVRSPWADRTSYTGWYVPQSVTVPAAALPAPAPGVTAVPLDRTVSPPAYFSLPDRPADPVWPAALPAPVAAPVPPATPGPAPSESSVPVQQRDDIGPGCGWAFTGQSAPVLDDATLVAARDAALSQTREQLLVAQQTWQENVAAFWAASNQYDTAARAFATYSAQVAAVTQAWAAISAQRQTYAVALADYQNALAAQAQFQAEQSAAQQAYEAAVAVCRSGTITSSPTASPTDTASPTPTGTGSPSPSVTTGPTPAPTVTTPPGCPPTRPTILDQLPPTVPPSPLPPPDPRPAGAIATPTR